MAQAAGSRFFLATEDEVVEGKVELEEQDDSGDETTPATTESECSEAARDFEWESEARDLDAVEEGFAHPQHDDDCAVPQLGPGLFPSYEQQPPSPRERSDLGHRAGPPVAAAAAVSSQEAALVAPRELPCDDVGFTRQETLFIFDWDDTILPSTWIQKQGLRLDHGSVVSSAQRERLGEAASAAAETLRLAKLHGTVVLLTNAERGWIELSCRKFMPMLLPVIEGVRVVSARTAFETADCKSPLEWKVLAFEAEVARSCGAAALLDHAKRQNIHSFGDSVHEREALMRATVGLPNCRAKSIKFVDHPDVSQLLSQHGLVAHSFDQILQHDGNLDLSITCS